MADDYVTLDVLKDLERRIELVDSSIGSTVDSGAISTTERFLVALCQGLAIYNAFELSPIILFTFRRYGGLYFWSMILSTLGVALNASAFVVNDFGLAMHRMVPALMIILGWIPMATGHWFGNRPTIRF